MCKWGDTMLVRVKIAADLSCNRHEKWKNVAIDRYISSIVSALQDAGIDMRGSCCGHGNTDGEIALADGRLLIIKADGERVLGER